MTREEMKIFHEKYRHNRRIVSTYDESESELELIAMGATIVELAYEMKEELLKELKENGFEREGIKNHLRDGKPEAYAILGVVPENLIEEEVLKELKELGIESFNEICKLKVRQDTYSFCPKYSISIGSRYAYLPKDWNESHIETLRDLMNRARCPSLLETDTSPC